MIKLIYEGTIHTILTLLKRNDTNVNNRTLPDGKTIKSL